MTSMDVTSNIELLDSEIKKIEDGPLVWANQRTGTRRNIDDFVNGLKDEFFKIGLYVYVEGGLPMSCKCHPPCIDLPKCPSLTPVQDDLFMTMVTITGRVSVQPFDFAQMQWEVRNNILNIPGQDKGTIKFDEREFLRQYGGKKHKHAG